MRKSARVFLYFATWVVLALVAILFNIINFDWSRTNIVNGVLMIVVLSMIQGSVLEITVQTIVTIEVSRNDRENKNISTDRLTVVLNYNLLASSTDDIDEWFEKMNEGYISNLGPNLSAVLVSATNVEELKKYELKIRDTYRVIIYKELFREGVSYAKGDYESVDPFRLSNVWRVHENIDPTVFLRECLDDMCHKYAREVSFIHRVSRVLRKCGQYQGLMLLSEGVDEAYIYCDPEYYGKCVRPYGQTLFHSSADVNNLLKR